MAATTLVQVDVYPTKDGKIVEGLTTADFEVFEDGKPQAVDGFEFVRIEPNTPDALRRDPNTQEEGNVSSPPIPAIACSWSTSTTTT